MLERIFENPHSSYYLKLGFVAYYQMEVLVAFEVNEKIVPLHNLYMCDFYQNYERCSLLL